MKIIDAHIHFRKELHFDQLAEKAGHQNTDEHLSEQYAVHGILHGVVMGNRSLQLSEHIYPEFLSYCIGLDSTCFSAEMATQHVESIEKHLQRKACVGIKLYPGYQHFYVYDALLDPFYQLAIKYNKPIAVHTGLTATSTALMQYSHPLTLDEAAARYPHVQFVMCHIGNPWIVDAVAVMMKNPNVAADLSGLLEGRIDSMPDFFARKHAYVTIVKGWLEYMNRYDRLLYGTDWPLANIANYIDLITELIPEIHHEQVFFANANRIYQLGL